jgi:tyrosyl-tRNA synthetase
LLTTATGAKMGKSVSGAVWLDPGLCSPFDFYQYWINVHDADVERFFKLYTFLDLGLISEIVRGDVRGAKRRLAAEVTAQFHGPEAASRAAEAAQAAFAGGATASMPTWSAALPLPVVDALVGSGLAKSKSDARRLIEGGGVSLGESRVASTLATIEGETVLWVGKKRMVRVVAA